MDQKIGIDGTPIPTHIAENLGNYGSQIKDGYCGEPIHWGYKIVSHLGEELWKEASNFGRQECVMSGDFGGSTWYLITKSLTRQEAIEKYGPETHVELGPRGGFKHIIFGKTKFYFKELRQ